MSFDATSLAFALNKPVGDTMANDQRRPGFVRAILDHAGREPALEHHSLKAGGFDFGADRVA